MPQPYGGLAAQGLGYQSTPGAFNYGMPNAMTSYGPGNSLGNSALSGAGGAMTAGFAGASILGGLGMLGTAGRVLDPFSMGMGGFRAGSAMFGGIGGGIMGAAAGAAIPLAIGAGVSHVAGSMVAGGQEQAGIEQVLSRFQFTNPNSRSGKGFNRQDSMQIGNMVRELAHIPDMLTSVSELTKVMDRISGMGLMNGIRDAQGFQTKFREALGTVKDVARILGTTLEEAAGAMGEARRSGFYSQTDIVKNAVNRQVTSGLTGMNQQQVGALQQFGAQIGFSTGGSRAAGARNATRTAQQIGMMNQMGILSNDQIAEMTGEEGGAGIQSLAASLTEAGYKMSRSSLGTALALATGEVRDGRYTGKMDQDIVNRVRRGEISKDELLRVAHQKASSRTAKLSFSAHRDRITSEMVGSVGAEGIAMELRGILGQRGFDNPDALSLVMQRYGVDERQADQIMSMGKMSSSGELQGRMGSEAKRISRNAYIAENFSWDAVKKKIGTKIESLTTEPFKKMGVGIRDSIATMMDDFIDDVTGHYSAQMSQGVQALIRDASAGKGGAAKSLSSLLGGAAPSAKFLSGSGKGGLAGAIRDFAGGSATDSSSSLAKSLGLGSLVGNVSAEQGSAAVAGFAKRLTSQGIEGLQKGHEASYNDAKNELMAILRSEDMEGKTDTEKWEIIRGKIDLTHARAVGSVQSFTTSAMERHARATGMTPERVAAGIMAGDKDVQKMKSVPNLVAALGGGGDLQGKTTEVLAELRKDMERTLGKSAGGAKGLSAVRSALQNASLVTGGALMTALTKSTAEQHSIMDAIISGDFDKVKKYGITPDNAQDALRLLRGTAGASDEERGNLLKFTRIAAHETDSLMREHMESREAAVRSLAAKGGALAGGLKGLADKLHGGDYSGAGAGAQIGALVQQIAAIKDPKQRRKVLDELAASGNYEIRAAYAEYESKGGLSGGKKAASALEAAIGKGTELLHSSAQGREGSVLASDEAVKNYFDKLNQNQEQITQMLGNIAAGKPANDGLNASKKQ
jgi:hypothetical protein